MCGLFGRVDNDRSDEEKRRKEPHICGRIMVERVMIELSIFSWCCLLKMRWFSRIA